MLNISFLRWATALLGRSASACLLWHAHILSEAFENVFGVPSSQFRAFVDTLGPLWQNGALANKTITATTSAQNPQGGQEMTIQSVYTTAMHWGAIIVPPGYADPIKFEDGGNPYGYSCTPGELSDTGKKSVAFQAERLVKFTKKLMG